MLVNGSTAIDGLAGKVISMPADSAVRAPCLSDHQRQRQTCQDKHERGVYRRVNRSAIKGRQPVAEGNPESGDEGPLAGE